MKICPKCHLVMEDNHDFCTNCGTKIDDSNKIKKVKTCKDCGFIQPSNFLFCVNCGKSFNKFKKAKIIKTNSNKKAANFKAVAFALFLIFFIGFIAFTSYVTKYDLKTNEETGNLIGFYNLNNFYLKFVETMGYSTLCISFLNIINVVAIIIIVIFVIGTILLTIKLKSLKKLPIEFKTMIIIFLIMLIFFIVFKIKVINYGPVLYDGKPVISYPINDISFIGMICLLSVITNNKFFEKTTFSQIFWVDFLNAIILALFLVVVLAFALSGLYWLTDIIASIIYMGMLVMLYLSLTLNKKKKSEH